MCYNDCSETVEDPCRKGLSFMRLPEPGTMYQLLKKYSPSQLVVFNEAYFFATENGRECGSGEPVNHIDDYYELDSEYISKVAWLPEGEVINTIKTVFKDDFDLLEVDKDGKKKYFIKEV